MRVSLPLEFVSCCLGPLILTGRAFDRLPLEQRVAVIAHEQGHQFLRHGRARLKNLFASARVKRVLALGQELDADHYAQCVGQGEPLIEFLSARPRQTGEYYPPTSQRIALLTKRAQHRKD